MDKAEQIRQRKIAALGIKGQPAQRLTLVEKLHFIIGLIPQIFIIIPVTLVWKHLLTRRSSQIVQRVGRPVLADFIVRVTKYIMEHSSSTQARIMMDRVSSYNKVATSSLLFGGYKDWYQEVEFNGVTGRWICPPNTQRAEDNVVLMMVHGGGFTLDSGGNSLVFFLALAKEMNLVRKVQFSIFLVDYELAPEHAYPSQIIESLASYHYLVNELKIAEEKICIAGDSAGGTLIAGLLLHLARPNPNITVPASFGATPGRPGSVCFISPHINLLASPESTKENADFDCLGSRFGNFSALDYIGVSHAQHVPSWNPVHLFTTPYPPTAKRVLSKAAYTKDGTGLELFKSPYANPSMCQDPTWWAEACPAGRTMVVWGGAEILFNEIKAFVKTLERAGVAPITLEKTHGMHDWIFIEQVIPGLTKTNTVGKDAKPDFGVKNVAAFLQGNDLLIRSAFWASKSSTK